MATPRSPDVDRRVTWRALLIGLLLALALGVLNCWIATVANVHFLGGVQMPFGSIFALFALTIAVQWPLRLLHRHWPAFARVVPPYSVVELLTIYCMSLLAALVSTPGTHNIFLTLGPSLFYFATNENQWANLFYQHVPVWFAPGWDGTTYKHEVVDKLFLGQITAGQIPWHAWTMMLTAWSIMLLLSYSLLFFLSLALRRQWTAHEALSFPLLQVPMQMVEFDHAHAGIHEARFWSNKGMWLGFALAAFANSLRGLNAHFPDWPRIPIQESQPITFTEHPWNVIGTLGGEIHLGGIGLAYLLPREISFSFWLFFLLTKFELVLCTILGFPELVLQRDTYQGQPVFITFQGIGGWVAMGAILLWTARGSLGKMCREALRQNRSEDGDPFSPRFIVIGFLVSFIALMGWCLFSGLSLKIALAFLGIYLLASLVLTRFVVETGYVFSQLTFSSLEWITTAIFGTTAIGASDLTRLTFVNTTLLRDARTNIMPGFMHTMKIAQELHLDRRQHRRLLLGVLAATALTLLVTLVVTLLTLYSAGTLSVYHFYKDGPQGVFRGTAQILKEKPELQPNNIAWMGVGATLVCAMAFARSRFMWFPLHPMGFLLASGGSMGRWWFPYFAGWLIKSIVMKYGGSDAYRAARPFMLGLILGNIAAMVFWMLIGLHSGVQVPWWPA